MPEPTYSPFSPVSPPVFRVYEHELLRVGEERDHIRFSQRHLDALAELSRRVPHSYFSLGHRSVRFKHYVGILATSGLTIEILPKVDRRKGKPDPTWQHILVDLLAACRFVRPEAAGSAALDTRPGALLNWYIRVFTDTLKPLLRQGLLHHYQSMEGELGVLKGRLNVSRQIRKQFLHRERFQVTYQKFADRHPANLMIGAALHKLQFLPLPADLREQLKHLSRYFPRPLHGEHWTVPDPRDLQIDHRLDHYTAALTIARHILQDERPDVRSGQYRGLALLFDMNLLFEEYIYRQLLRWKEKTVSLERQQSTVFWGQNRLRPDLVIASSQGRWVLDTKWRMLPRLQPSADELRQIYVYCDYFKAKRGVLIFPYTGQDRLTCQEQFSPLPFPAHQDRSCQLYFARVLNPDGKLNRELGKEILDMIGIGTPGERMRH